MQLYPHGRELKALLKVKSFRCTYVLGGRVHPSVPRVILMAVACVRASCGVCGPRASCEGGGRPSPRDTLLRMCPRSRRSPQSINSSPSLNLQCETQPQAKGSRLYYVISGLVCSLRVLMQLGRTLGLALPKGALIS